jgi:hypothetical protein
MVDKYLIITGPSNVVPQDFTRIPIVQVTNDKKNYVSTKGFN